MTHSLSLSNQADAWFDEPESQPYTLDVAEWLADLCDDPDSVTSAPVPNIDGYPTRSSFVNKVQETSVAVAYTVFNDPAYIRVHKIRGSWSVPMM